MKHEEQNQVLFIKSLLLLHHFLISYSNVRLKEFFVNLTPPPHVGTVANCNHRIVEWVQCFREVRLGTQKNHNLQR